MTQTIDCLLIGHNEMDFAQYEEAVRKMGLNSGAYRDLDLNFIRYNNRPYSTSEIFNIFYYQDKGSEDDYFHVAESFSAAVAYLGTYLHRRGYTFDYVNAFQYSRAELAEKLTRDNILTIAVTTTLYVSVLPILEIIKFIREHNRTAKIIIGGPFVSTSSRTLDSREFEQVFHSVIGADIYVNSSQGEAALAAIIEALRNGMPLDGIPNIYYEAGSGLRATPVSREDNRLSENMVDWSLFTDKIGKYVNVRTAISCPFSCSFCGFPEHAGKFQAAAAEDIETELKQLEAIETVKDKCVHFVDDTFNVPVQRFKDILRMIIKNKFRFKWHSYFRCQYADEEMVALMKESGCEGVFLGIESGSTQILKNMNKAADIPAYLKGIELLKKHGIVTYGNFIIGFPGETEETVKDTIRFIETGGLDFFRTQLWYCEPITPIWRQRDRYKIEGERFEWKHATMDTKKACDLVEEIFFTIKEPTWVPQYNFDFDSFWHLVHRGMSIDEVRNFLRSFNRAVQEKLKESRREIGYKALEQIKKACLSNDIDEEKKKAIDGSKAAFEFL